MFNLQYFKLLNVKTLPGDTALQWLMHKKHILCFGVLFSKEKKKIKATRQDILKDQFPHPYTRSPNT